MLGNNPNYVLAAFEMLLGEVEAEIDFVNGIGARSSNGRDCDKSKEALGATIGELSPPQ